MKNDIMPPRSKRPSPKSVQSTVLSDSPNTAVDIPVNKPTDKPSTLDLPTIEEPAGPPAKPDRKRLKRLFIGVVVVVLLLVGAISYLISPRDSSAQSTIPVEIVSGTVPSQIATLLEEKGVIRSQWAFRLYARLSNAQGSLQAGNYELSPASSLASIVAQLEKGPDSDEIEVTFKPGATLKQNKEVLLALGYGGEEIDKAFKTQYDSPLFESHPADADIEGYLYGETHRFAKDATLKTILERYFDDYYTVVKENNLIALYKKQGLSLYQGITLASIVQRESGGDDKAQIAQVFLRRLASDIQLGSDVTYQYIADKEGKPRDINYDSPYNTRRYTGLPPGPISSPGVAALKAVANPASGDYLYFLSGDDNVTYFARNLAEHEANIRDHCQEKCKIL